MRLFLKDDVQSANVAATSSLQVALGRVVGYFAQADITVQSPAAGAFTAAASDLCTMVAHGFMEGLKVTLTTSAGDLPLNLLIATDYFIIPVSADTFKLASSLAFAQAGTPVDIADAGSGTHTITPTALAGCTAYLTACAKYDGTFVLIPESEQTVTASGTFQWNVSNPHYKYLEVVYSLSAGQLSISQTVIRREA